MEYREALQYIQRADRIEIQELLDAAMERYRVLYPDWDIWYCAVEKKDKAARERLSAFLNGAHFSCQ